MKTFSSVFGCLLTLALSVQAGAPNGPNASVPNKPNVPVTTKPNVPVTTKPNVPVTTKPNVPVNSKPGGKNNVNVKNTKKIQKVNLE